MIQFKQLELEDKEVFETYLKPYTFQTSEYSFTNLFIWRKGCRIEYTILNNALIIKKRDFSGHTYFMQPIGYKKDSLKELVEELIKLKEELKLDYLFGDVEEAFAKDLNEVLGEIFVIEEDRDNFDYIYESSKLAALSGNKLHKKKNHYNHFIKNYSYEVVEITEQNAAECIAMAEEWYNGSSDNEHLLHELEAIKELLTNKSRFDYQGLAVIVDNKPAAFTIGEKLNENMAVIHIEKANSDINGLYTFINKAFVEMCYKDVLYINREQDLGIENLRKAKESYYPVKMGIKYKIKPADLSCCYMHSMLSIPVCAK